MSKWRRAAALTGFMLGLGLALGTGVEVGPASAQVPARGGKKPSSKGVSPGHARAQEHYRKARELYARGQYRAAVDELQSAIELDPNGSELRYNMALIYEKMGDIPKAIEHYAHYATMDIPAPEKQRVEGIVERLKGVQREIDEARAAASASTSPVASASASSSASTASEAPIAVPSSGIVGAEPQRGVVDGLVIGTGAVAAVGLVVGAVFGVKAWGEKNDSSPTTSAGTSYSDLQDHHDNARRDALIADIGFGVAVVSGLTAAALYWGRSQPQAEATTTVSRTVPMFQLTPNAVSAGVKVGF